MRVVEAIGRSSGLLLAALFVAAGTSVAAVPIGSGPAWAADPPDSLSIEGAGISRPIVVRPVQPGDLFALLLRHVDWMTTRAGDAMTVDRTKLGARYTVVLWVGPKRVHTLEVYPLASGGPRGHRPAASRPAKVAEAWFYAPVDLPNLLRLAGVPVAAGGAGGQVDAAACWPVRTPDTGALSAPTSGPLWGRAVRMALASVFAGVFVLLLLFNMIRFRRRRRPRREVRPDYPLWADLTPDRDWRHAIGER